MTAEQPDASQDAENDPTAHGLGAKLAAFANWFNEHVVGSPWTYLFCIFMVVGIYLLIIPLGYTRWNTGPGLFSNTAESSVELITGVGAVVGVYAVRRSQKRHQAEAKALHAGHRSEVTALHSKLDVLAKAHADMAAVVGKIHGHVSAPQAAADERMGALAVDTEQVRAENSAAEVRDAQAPPSRRLQRPKGERM